MTPITFIKLRVGSHTLRCTNGVSMVYIILDPLPMNSMGFRRFSFGMVEPKIGKDSRHDDLPNPTVQAVGFVYSHSLSLSLFNYDMPKGSLLVPTCYNSPNSCFFFSLPPQ